MRTPSWETSAGALAAMLGANTSIGALDLYTVTLPGGLSYLWTGGDVPVTINGRTWTLGPILTRGKTSLSVGVAVDTLDVHMAPPTGFAINSVPFLAFVSRGGFDGARITVERAYFAPGATAATGILFWFGGRVADVVTSRMGASVTVNSDMELLNVMLPREVWQPGCLNTLYDSACGVNRASVTLSATVSVAMDVHLNSFQATFAAAFTPVGRLDMGTVTFTTGANAGLSRTVRTATLAGGSTYQITTLNPWPVAAAIGDAFTVVPGCTKALELPVYDANGVLIGRIPDPNGCSKFSNQAHFRGMPYIPSPESII